MNLKQPAMERCRFAACTWALSTVLGLSVTAQQQKSIAPIQKAEASNFELVGYSDLQGRGAYQPVVQKQGDRYIAYVGAQTGTPKRVNPLNGKDEFSGTSIIDVTDPKNPKYLFHIPGESRPTSGIQPSGTGFGPGRFPPGEAEFMRVCSGRELPHAPDKNKFYMLRVFGHSAWEMWDVTDPAKPVQLNNILTGLTGTHRPSWECDTGVAFLPAGLMGWQMPPPGESKRDSADHLTIWDLSNPEKPALIRHWGLPGQNPGSISKMPRSGLHIVMSGGSQSHRVYVSYGNDSEGIFLILDREKLLNGPKEPTDENVTFPIIARVDLPRDIGAHTMIPLKQMELPQFSRFASGNKRDFLALISQQAGNECRRGNDGQDGSPQMVRFFDVSTEAIPVGVSTWTVPESSGNFCSRGGRFGPPAAKV
jgi:hypothetical protein